MVKVICAGAPKTGTKSMSRALRILGYNQVYDYEDALDSFFEEWDEIFQGKNSNISGFLNKCYTESIEAVVDLPHSYFFEEYLKLWPDAKVILMTRDEDGCFTSYKNMLDQAKKDHPIYAILPYFSPTSRKMNKWHMHMFNCVFGHENASSLLWKMWFRRHNNYVKSVVSENQLMIYQVQDGWAPLCNFLAKEVPEVDFPFENKAGSKTSIAERVIAELPMVRQIEKEAKIAFTVIPIIVLAILYYAFMT